MDVLRQFADQDETRGEEAWFIAGILVATRSDRVRNAAAMALADINARDAGASIIEVLRRPDIPPSSGTLLHAAGELGLQIGLDTLVHIIERGSYEARAMALDVAERNGVAVTYDQEFETTGEKLRKIAREAADPEAAEAADAALSLLFSGERTP